jgi:hypothetical protein
MGIVQGIYNFFSKNSKIGITIQIHSDKIKLHRFTLHLYFADDFRR